MPRQMPRFDRHLQRQSQLASEIVKAGERARIGWICSTHPSTATDQEWESGKTLWTVQKIESLYELAYLRVFSLWESTLESIFYRTLCGYNLSYGKETLVCGQYFRTLAQAEAAVLGTHQFTLWHSQWRNIQRCQQFIRSNPGDPAKMETVLSSRRTLLDWMSAIRHRIAHDQQNDAHHKFESATRGLVGMTYHTPGRFLREWDTTASTPRRRLDWAIDELVSLASQIV